MDALGLLRPAASVSGLPAAHVPHAASGFALGDHAGRAPDAPAEGPGVVASASSGPLQRRFEPYQNNGGTVLAVAGKDFCVVASDTRLGLGYSIPSRKVSRILKMTDKVVLASSGMQADMMTLHKTLRMRLVKYQQNHQKDMSLTAASQMLSNMLYTRRFFPYYTFNVLGGIDEKGEGWAYGYDAIGSHEKVSAVCSGTGQTLIQPVLDNQIEFKQQWGAPKVDLSLEATVELIRDAFTSAGERDIYTGDYVEICKITKDGVEVEEFQLKFD